MTLGSRQLSAATILLLFAVLPLSSQIHAPNPIQPPNRAYRPKRMGLAKWEPTPQEVQASYWSLEPGWNTELEIRNNLAERNLTVIPTLRTAAGREIALTPVSLASEQIVAIDLRSAAASVAPEIVNSAGSFGSVAVRFGGLDGANVFAASVVHRDGHPIDFHFDGYDAASNAGYYSGIEGIWWVPTGTATDYLIVANPSPKMVKGILRLTSPSGPSAQRALILGPRQTTRIDIREVLGPSANGSMGGLTLSLPQREGISATEIIFDETTGFTAIMKLFERYAKEQVASHVLRAPMMALSQPDPSLAFPQNTALAPRLFLRNARPSGLPVSLAVDWRSQNASGTYQFPLLHLKPGELRTVELGKAQENGLIPENAHWGTVRVSYAGNSADLVPVALSYDSTGRYGLQTPFTEGTSRMFKGSMWHVDPTHNTLLTTGNGGSEATTAQVTLFYNGGQGRYRVEKVLQPGQQLWLDVGQLIHNQVPDSDGEDLAARHNGRLVRVARPGSRSGRIAL